MCQREWDPGACCAEDRSRSGQPDRWVCQDPFDEIALSLTQSGALLFEEQVPRSPGQHQKCDEPCQQQREPAAFQELRSVGGDKYQIDDEEEAVDGGYDERAEAPMQRDEPRQHRGHRHQHRDGDAVCAAEGVGGPECDDRSKRTGGQEPIDNRNVNLPRHRLHLD